MSAWSSARKFSFVMVAIVLAGSSWPVTVHAQQPPGQAAPQQQPPPQQQSEQMAPALSQQQI